MHYHLLHGTFLKETAVIVTIDAVIVISTSIGVTAYLVLVDERHPAALTIFQIIFHSIKPEFSSHQFLMSEPCRLLVSKAFYFILFILGVGAFEEIHSLVAFKGEDVRCYSVEEPSVVGDDDGAAGEVFQAFFESA